MVKRLSTVSHFQLVASSASVNRVMVMTAQDRRLALTDSLKTDCSHPLHGHLVQVVHAEVIECLIRSLQPHLRIHKATLPRYACIVVGVMPTTALIIMITARHCPHACDSSTSIASLFDAKFHVRQPFARSHAITPRGLIVQVIRQPLVEWWVRYL